MLRKKILSSLLLITFITGCDSDDKKEDTPPSLAGVWNSSCIADDSDPDDVESSVSRIEFTETEVVITERIYSDLVCESIAFEFTLSGTYEVGEIVSTPSGVDATEIDFILTQASSSFGVEFDDYDNTLLQLFVIEGTYLYLGHSLDDDFDDLTRPKEIDFSSWLELQE